VKLAVAPAPVFKVALYEGVGSRPLDASTRSELLRTLLEKGYAVTSIRPGGKVNQSVTGTLVVLGRYEEQKPATAEGDGGVTLYFRDIESLDAAGVLGVVESIRGELNAPPPSKWKPWFPVIDYGRCTNCMQCLSFCLFDVYGVDGGGKIKVQKATNCKTDCPACSRVCPEVAILFPKYKGGPINGDEVRQEDLQREKMKVDISALLGGDIYAALRQRSADAKGRFSKERDEKKALEERKRCLAKLQEGLGIPQEVMDALPSLEQIQKKTAAAMANASDG
jgi:NAD-dependent dihydropyrimidine dehydrogenase PreA subunit